MTTKANDDDDFMIIDGKQVLKDGRKLTVGVRMMDAATITADAALHRPGVRATTDVKVVAAYGDMIVDLGTAWREPLPEVVTGHEGSRAADAQAAAYNAMVRGLESAWKGAAA
jgi:hypothetical protein